MDVSDLKLEVYVDGKNIYDNAKFEIDLDEVKEHMVLKTSIGKTKKQSLKVVISRMNYVEAEEESTDKKNTDE